MIVFHHSKDLDGWSSGAICQFKYPEAKLIGWDYADPIPDFEQCKDQEVILIDITFPLEQIIKLSSIASTLVVIDHHISFKKEFDAAYPNYENCPFDYIYKDGVAACEIGWEYMFPDKEVPYAITLLGRYDTWRQAEGDWEGETLPFQYAMRTYCTSPETFEKSLFYGDGGYLPIIDQLKTEGKAILKYQEQQDMLACERSAFEAFIDGKQVICLNTRFFSSNTLKTVYNPIKHSFMVGFEFTGNKWSVSLRSDKPDVDVSVIAKSRGGGGHKAAAGFECNTFEEIFI